jgi:hypothetical protein
VAAYARAATLLSAKHKACTRLGRKFEMSLKQAMLGTQDWVEGSLKGHSFRIGRDLPSDFSALAIDVGPHVRASDQEQSSLLTRGSRSSATAREADCH